MHALAQGPWGAVLDAIVLSEGLEFIDDLLLAQRYALLDLENLLTGDSLFGLLEHKLRILLLDALERSLLLSLLLLLELDKLLLKAPTDLRVLLAPPLDLFLFLLLYIL